MPLEEILQVVFLSLAKWIVYKKEFKEIQVHNLYKRDACMKSRLFKVKNSVSWSPPPNGFLKFDVDGAARGKPGPACISGVLCNDKEG